MKFREIIAKGFCVLTIALLSLNIAFSNFSLAQNNSKTRLKSEAKFNKLADLTTNVSLFENEIFEELEDAEEVFPLNSPSDFTHFQKHFTASKTACKENYSTYKFTIQTIAKWLEVRHILI